MSNDKIVELVENVEVATQVVPKGFTQGLSKVGGKMKEVIKHPYTRDLAVGVSIGAVFGLAQMGLKAVTNKIVEGD